MTAKLLATLLAAALVAGALLLPERIAVWGDEGLLNRIHTTAEEERSSFSESAQLTVAEKLLLMQGGTLSSMELDNISLPFPASAAMDAGGSFSGEAYGVTGDDDALLSEMEETRKTVEGELLSLQAAGGLPVLWDGQSDLECIIFSRELFVDANTRLSFLVCHLTLLCMPFQLTVSVDGETGKLLSFSLESSVNVNPDWGETGAVRFGPAWRDYWGMDSVEDGWDSKYNMVTLELAWDQPSTNGYASHGGIVFFYGGESLGAGLSGWHSKPKGIGLEWNIYPIVTDR